MGELHVRSEIPPDSLRMFMKSLLTDLRALETMIDQDRIETGIRRIGVEQEMFLVDRFYRPAPVSMEILERLDDPAFTTELARFNLEFNLPPLELGGDCLSRLETQLTQHLDKVRAVAREYDADVVLTGILPTLLKSDLGLDRMTPLPRYAALNRAIRSMRGGDFEFRFAGTDELIIKHDSVMLEACNTSFQVHFQVAPAEFARLYNIAQVVAAPVLAAAVNSPLLFGKRLLKETRIALFQQAVDTRRMGHQILERNARVSFGNQWIRDSVLEIFRDDISRFRVIFATDEYENPFAAIARGAAPELRALQLHNSTVYRWNRACYGSTNGKPHLRIENRILPSGPTILDEVANAAFWFGLMSGILEEFGDVTRHIEFDEAKSNFWSAARSGLKAEFVWLDGQPHGAQQLLMNDLIPLARLGLRASGIRTQDVDRYLNIIEQRVEKRQTGASWILNSFAKLRGQGAKTEQLTALTAAMIQRQQEGKPVHEWPLAEPDEPSEKDRIKFQRVEQYMTTDLFTVCEDEIVDLVANLMDWHRIRHVPVEDDQHRLVGLVSYRALLRLLGRDEVRQGAPIPVSAIMQKDPITVTPETPTLDAIQTMRTRHISCLPVVKDDRLVGIVTERDFVHIAAELLISALKGRKESDPPS